VHSEVLLLISLVVPKVVVGNDVLGVKRLLNLMYSHRCFDSDILGGVETGEAGQVGIVGDIVEKSRDGIAVEWETDDVEEDRDEEIEEGSQRVEVGRLELVQAVDIPSEDKQGLVA
jgi:hypothetical protein